MKKILFTSWLAETLRAQVPFLRKRDPWYRRYARIESPWVPAVLIAPLALYFIWRGAMLLTAGSSKKGQ